MSKYDDLDRETLIRLLQRRDAERQLALVWERDEIGPRYPNIRSEGCRR